jgi:hypothetical protein
MYVTRSAMFTHNGLWPLPHDALQFLAQALPHGIHRVVHLAALPRQFQVALDQRLQRAAQ